VTDGFKEEDKTVGDILHYLAARETECDGTVREPGWYFWDECWQRVGPFTTKDEAQTALFSYTENL
jgi:hypothetical protein